MGASGFASQNKAISSKLKQQKIQSSVAGSSAADLDAAICELFAGCNLCGTGGRSLPNSQFFLGPAKGPGPPQSAPLARSGPL